MITLGINAAFHDPSACLVADGRVLAAAEEERFTRIKHGKRPLPFTVWELPFHAIDYCLAEAGIELAEVDHVAYSYDPETRQASTSRWDPLALTYVRNAEEQLVDGAQHHLKKRFASAKRSRRWRWHFVEHHLAHEASAFLAAPFDECAVMTLDGRGELATTSYGRFAGGRYERLGRVEMPHSLGLLYEEVTEHLGFLRSSDEYKVWRSLPTASPLSRTDSAPPFASETGAGMKPTRHGGRLLARRAKEALRSSSGTTTSPARFSWCWRNPRCGSPPGCERRPAARTSPWPAAWRSIA
jgi:predicted NodU family carbamoyl transferase